MCERNPFALFTALPVETSITRKHALMLYLVSLRIILWAAAGGTRHTTARYCKVEYSGIEKKLPKSCKAARAPILRSDKSNINRFFFFFLLLSFHLPPSRTYILKMRLGRGRIFAFINALRSPSLSRSPRNVPGYPTIVSVGSGLSVIHRNGPRDHRQMFSFCSRP